MVKLMLLYLKALIDVVQLIRSGVFFTWYNDPSELFLVLFHYILIAVFGVFVAVL